MIKMITWENSEWTVRTFNHQRCEPGKNYYTGDCVEVDAHGHLLLRIKNIENVWNCASLYSRKAYGFGTFTFQIYGAIDALDHNVLLQLFTHLPAYTKSKDKGAFSLEFGKWESDNVSYTLNPDTHAVDNQAHFQQSGGHTTTHQIVWKPDSIQYQSFYGMECTEKQCFASWSYESSDTQLLPQKPAPLHIALYLRDGQAPSNDKPVVVAISSLSYTPL